MAQINDITNMVCDIANYCLCSRPDYRK